MSTVVPSPAEIPRRTIYRLSIYQRCLQLLKSNGVETVSSATLAGAAGVKPTQLRKDLAHFGHFGVRGRGYSVELLSSTIGEQLGRTRLQPVILVGVGNLGSALLRYQGFEKEGFEIVAAFDADPVRRLPPGAHTRMLLHTDRLAAFIAANEVRMAILAVPPEAAQAIVNTLVNNGVQAILNFSPTVLSVPEGVTVNSVDLAAELENLSYFIR